MENDFILEIRNLHKDFDRVKIIQGVDLSVRRGERHAIIGPNGAGKTTVYNLVTGRYKPSAGKVFFNGKDITGLPPHKVNRLGVSRSFQITNIFPKLSVFENVRAAILSKHKVRYNFISLVDRMDGIAKESREILEEINLHPQKDVLAGELSYGDQRALEIGITLATDPNLIMLDEPTSGMSINETRGVVKLIDRMTKGKTLVIIEHDMDVVFSLADVITVIHYGKVLASGAPEEIRQNQLVKDAYLGEKK